MSTSGCEYRKLTTRFKNTLKLPDEMFDSQHDYCFCPDCHRARGDKEHYFRGKSAGIYVLPLNWRRFGIQIQAPPGVTASKAFRDWPVAFHGTEFKSIESIWRVGLRIPGETTWNDEDIVELCGHYNDDDKPDDFDTKKIFVSPSSRYSGSDAYARGEKYTDPKTKRTYVSKIIFQLRIKPGTYDVGPKTIHARKIDPYIDDRILEWSTKNKEAIMLTGLLLKMTPLGQS